MSKPLGWRFPSLDDSEHEGINDSITKAFAGDHEHFIARECIQNSIDHRLDPSKPVKVVFTLKSYDRELIPGMEQLTDVITRSLTTNYSHRAKQELEAIKRAATSTKIPTLVVSDYNTEGLSGNDHDKNGSWHRLVRAVGSNDPSGVGGGSYGLGKGAPFAASGIRTVFYSTINESGEYAFQGKTRLVTHEGEDGDLKRGIGFYGEISKSACRSIRSKEGIPSYFARSHRGTDIIIPSYKSVSENWQLRMVHSVLKNFWPAIHERMLEVEFYDDTTLKEIVNADNLAAFLEQYSGEETDNAYYYYSARTSPDEDGHFSDHIDGLGEVELFVKRGDDYPKRVQQMRAPLMVVSTEPYHRSLLDPYVGVLICRDKEGNDFLKNLEPPQHDKWNPSLGDDDPKVLKENERIYKSLQDWVRGRLKSLSRAYEGEMTEIPGLAEYLSTMERDDLMPFGKMDRSTEDQAEETGVERIKPIKTETKASRTVTYSYRAVKADSGPEDGGGGGNGGSGGGTGGGDASKKGKSQGRQRSPIRVRNIGMLDSGGFTDVELCLYSKVDFEGTVRLLATGEDMNAGIKVIHAHSTDGVAYPIKSGRVQNLKIDSARPTRLTVRIEGSNLKYALGVESRENNS